MKIGVFLCIALLAASDVVARGRGGGGRSRNRRTHVPAPAPEPEPVEPWVAHTIEPDQVQPFPEPLATIVSDIASVKFKPQLHISDGLCHPYPAVNAAGETSSGFILTGPDRNCQGSKLGSQLYARSTWHRGRFAIMYAWHIPTDKPAGERHDWGQVVVWLDNPAVPHPALMAASVWDDDLRGYLKLGPPGPEFMSGVSVKLNYGKGVRVPKMSYTTVAGQFQPLITWTQLPGHALSALNTVLWNKQMMPLSDARFTAELDSAWPS